MTPRTAVALLALGAVCVGVTTANRIESSVPMRVPSQTTPATAMGAQRGAEVPPMPAPKRRIPIAKGGNLQRALDEARPGDQIELENGATYTGPFQLRRKDGSEWIVVTSASFAETSASSAVPEGKRVTPAQAPQMAKLQAADHSVVVADEGAHHYRFVGLEIMPAPGSAATALVQLGDDQRALDRVPHHIIIDRCYLRGDPAKGTRRGIALNSAHSAVVNSHLADFKTVGSDSQAISGWNGPGPFTISNNYLEAAGENVMFGGADPSIDGLVPADILVTSNHVTKPLRWKKGHSEFEGTPWSVKNLFELKNARRVVIDGNVFEYNWPDAQNGFAILLTVRNQSGGAPWSVVEDVDFTNNVVRHVAAGVNILGRDDNHPSQQTGRIAIRGNLFADVGGPWGSGRLFQLLDGTRDVSIINNTALQSGTAVFGGDHAPHLRFVFENNLVLHNQIAIGGSGSQTGKPTLVKYFPGAVVRRNVFVGGDASLYPDGNFFPSTLEAAGLQRTADGWYRRAPSDRPSSSRTMGGDAGSDAGADLEALAATVTRVVASGEQRTHHAITESAWLAWRASALRPDPSASGWPSGVISFWVSFFLLAYVYTGYPAIAWLRSRLCSQRRVLAPLEPTVSIVVAAHNEADRIEARIENLLALDYPAERREIIIGSDGSTDDTAWRARCYDDAGVRVRAFRKWRGKAAVLNDLVRFATGDIILFADARQRFDANVIRHLVAHFADPSVGAVSGELMVSADEHGTSVGRGTSFYWRYEKFIRLHESRVASTVGATGAIYAIRRALFEPIPTDTLLDDVVIPLRIVRQGYSVRFEPGARAFESASASAHQECVRKLRTIAGTFQLFARERWLLNPWKNPIWFQTVSHKGLRLTLPVFHSSLLFATIALNADPFFQVALAGQVAFYGAALTGHACRHARRRPLILTVPYAMCLMLWATVAGFFRFVTHRQLVTWEQSAPAVLRRSAPHAR